MSVDFEAIAQRGRCDVSSLRLALPLLEQGYTPPFLARYRRDELGGLDEASLWALSNAVHSEQAIASKRHELHAAWEQTPLHDPAIGHAIQKSNSVRMLARLGRRLKREESAEHINDSTRLAVRVLNPQKGDGDDFAAIAAKLEGLTDAGAAVASLNSALAKRLAGDPRIIGAAVRWLAKNARIFVSHVSDPHNLSDEPEAPPTGKKKKRKKGKDASPSEPDAVAELAAADTGPEAVEPEIATESTPVAETAPTEDAVVQAVAEEPPAPEIQFEAAEKPADPELKQSKGPKKVSPRQRRRRWLVSVLKSLEGKRFNSDKLSPFQIVMLSRALRSQVATCSFEYDATKLVGELQRTATGINRHIEQQLRDLVLEHEAVIREAAEAAWWEDLQERASARLVTITAEHLHRQVNRGGVEAKVVMAIDAIGPRTAATTIVAADGRVLHCEDIPCQLSAAQRSQSVAKMGELIHSYHVDLVVVSNGPARRASMIALGDLIAQSPEKSVRWTVADRSGADAYASSAIADQEMRSTPRRFRAAAWLAFSIMQPAQAIAKVEPLKLRLSSFQRELSEEAMLPSLEEVMVSGASRGGVDVNSAPASWLARLPGMNLEVANAIDRARRQSLFGSRQALSELEQWQSTVQSRQSLPFLRVFNSDEVLDGTLIHPEDYALARKLANALGIGLPPACPPGYSAPDFSVEPVEPAQLVEAQAAPAKPVVEDFTAAGERASEFALDPISAPEAEAAPEPTADETPAPEASEDVESANVEATAELSAPAEVPSDAAVPAPAANENAATDPIKRPRPDRAKIEKCIKEWQIGAKRAHQLVSWLCDPFGDSDVSGQPPAVLTSMPTIASLKEDDTVIGVVVGVMPFGVFVELAPDCSGLIHVSRISETFVEDLHEAVQVGDVITAWVTGIDDKRRRVALSAVSPLREAELVQARHAREESRQDRGPRGRGPGRGGPAPARAAQPAPAQTAQGPTQTRGGKPAGQPARAEQSRGKPTGKPGGRGGDRQGSRDNRGRGQGRERKLESYRVVSKEETKPITEEMQQGKVPLRSFGDLLQFFGGDADKSKSQEKSKSTEKNKAQEQPAAKVPRPENIDTPELSADESPLQQDPSGPENDPSPADLSTS
jgi:protein Tex